MKIAHVQVIPQMSGVQQISYDILTGISGDFDKHIICGVIQENSHDFLSNFESAGIKVTVVPSLRREIGIHDLFAFLELYKLFKYERYDIVHTNSTKPGIIARIAARLAGISKIIHTVHGIAFHRYVNWYTRALYLFLENIAIRFGDVNVLVNNYYSRFYPLSKSITIYNGVHFPRLENEHPKFECDTSCKEYIYNEINLAFMARLDDQKNPLEFIRMANELLSVYRGPLKIRFTLAGHGELWTECHDLISSLGLQDKVSMPGWIKDKHEFFQSVSILCQPSRWEAFGLNFVEAAYYKVPSIASDVEGIPEVVIDNLTGLIFREGDRKHFISQVLKLLNEPNLIYELGGNAYIFAKERFGKEKMVAAYQAIYTGSDTNERS